MRLTPVAMSQQTKTLAIFVTLVLAAFFGASFLAPRRAVPPVSTAPRVAATIFPIYDIVRNVAGDAVAVTLVLPPGGEPHSYEPTPTTAAAVYAVGHGLDDWIDRALTESTTAKVVVDRGISLRGSPRTTSLDGEDAAADDTEDPHYWLTVPNAMIVAETVADDLAARFPADAPTFRENLARYRAELAAVDADVRASLADAKNANIVTFHDAWYYFAEEYGLRVAGTFEPAPGREPTARGLATLKEAVDRNRVRTLYAEPLFSDAAVSSFARDEGLNIAAIDDLGGVAGRDSYASLMRFNAETIRKNQ
jgi:zinc transport system substrate-binding protein